jgi:hypothetical protein
MPSSATAYVSRLVAARQAVTDVTGGQPPEPSKDSLAAIACTAAAIEGTHATGSASAQDAPARKSARSEAAESAAAAHCSVDDCPGSAAAAMLQEQLIRLLEWSRRSRGPFGPLAPLSGLAFGPTEEVCCAIVCGVAVALDAVSASGSVSASMRLPAVLAVVDDLGRQMGGATMVTPEATQRWRQWVEAIHDVACGLNDVAELPPPPAHAAPQSTRAAPAAVSQTAEPHREPPGDQRHPQQQQEATEEHPGVSLQEPVRGAALRPDGPRRLAFVEPPEMRKFKATPGHPTPQFVSPHYVGFKHFVRWGTCSDMLNVITEVLCPNPVPAFGVFTNATDEGIQLFRDSLGIPKTVDRQLFLWLYAHSHGLDSTNFLRCFGAEFFVKKSCNQFLHERMPPQLYNRRKGVDIEAVDEWLRSPPANIVSLVGAFGPADRHPSVTDCVRDAPAQWNVSKLVAVPVMVAGHCLILLTTLAGVPVSVNGAEAEADRPALVLADMEKRDASVFGGSYIFGVPGLEGVSRRVIAPKLDPGSDPTAKAQNQLLERIVAKATIMRDELAKYTFDEGLFFTPQHRTACVTMIATLVAVSKLGAQPL